MPAIERQKRGEQWRKEGERCIPHPAKWLDEGRWEDETDMMDAGGENHELRAWQDSRWSDRLAKHRWKYDP